MENTSLGTFIKNARVSKGYSCGKFSNMCGITVQALWKIETDQCTPYLCTLKEICKNLEIDFGEALAKSTYSEQIDTNPENNILGTSIKNARIAKGYSLRGFSIVCGVSYPHLCCIENGKSPTPRISTLKEICSNLDDNLSDVLRKSGYSEEQIDKIYFLIFSIIQK